MQQKLITDIPNEQTKNKLSCSLISLLTIISLKSSKFSSMLQKVIRSVLNIIWWWMCLQMGCSLHVSLVVVFVLVLPSNLPAEKNSGQNYGSVERSRRKTDLQHPPSPCPSVFSYEGQEAEKDQWFGVILVTTEELLAGLRLDMRLDKPASLLGVRKSLYYYRSFK